MSTKPNSAPSAHDLAANAMESDELPHRIIEWPGRMGPTIRAKLSDRRVALVILSRQEKFDAQVAATDYLFKEQKLDAIQLAMLQPEGLFEFEREVQFLSKVLRAPGDVELEAFSADDLRGALSTEAQEALMRAYNAFERDESPLTHLEDPEQVKAYLRALKTAGGLSTFVTCSDFGTGKSIALALVELLLEQPSESSSAT